VPDHDYLARIYLGKRRQPRESKDDRPAHLKHFSLRNLPLHLDQLLDLRVDAVSLAKTMAQILATMLWESQIDANDVEFVLGGSGSTPSTRLFDAQMCLLDFDYCQKMQADARGVNQAVAAFFWNDPYYPRPIPGDEWLWEVFKEYLVHSTSITGGDITLAELFIAVFRRSKRSAKEGSKHERMKNTSTRTYSRVEYELSSIRLTLQIASSLYHPWWPPATSIPLTRRRLLLLLLLVSLLTGTLSPNTRASEMCSSVPMSAK
jgi:hypothetical protein